MTSIQKQFFALIQSGLWGTDIDATLFDAKTDWQQLYQQAKAQTLLGIMLDGIQALPQALQPSRPLYLKWCNTLLHIENSNHLINKEIANVYKLYRANGIEPVLVKGQGVARNYRNPLHRHCGDIDLYIGPENYEKANLLLQKEATVKHEENYKHTSMQWHGVDIENHRILARLSSPIADRRLQQSIASWHGTDACQSIEIEGYRVTLPPPAFEVVYVLTHSILHFLNEGVGLRQVCDWACLLHACNQESQRKEIALLLKQWGLENTARIFGMIAVNYLGLPAQALPIAYTEKDLKIGEWLLNDIWQGGNFGQYDQTLIHRPKGYWSGKWYAFIRSIRRSYKFSALAPGEAGWHPFALVVQTAQVQCNKSRKKLSFVC